MPLEVDAASVLFPVAEAGGLWPVATADLPWLGLRTGRDRRASRQGLIGLLRLFLLQCIHDDEAGVCQIRNPFTILKSRAKSFANQLQMR